MFIPAILNGTYRFSCQWTTVAGIAFILCRDSLRSFIYSELIGKTFIIQDLKRPHHFLYVCGSALCVFLAQI
jgi:hypothetical protein